MTQNKIPDMRLVVDGEDDRSYVVVAVNVAPEGITFIRSEMLQYGPLSRKVARLFGTGGIAFAPMEAGTTSEYAKNFEHDSVGIEISHKWLAEYATFHWGTGCQVIIEEPWSKMEDEALRTPDVRYFGSEGFPYFTSQSGSLFKDLGEAARQTSFLRFGFIVYPPVHLPPYGNEADVRTVEKLAQNTRMAFMSAYDDMGYVVWMP